MWNYGHLHRVQTYAETSAALAQVHQCNVVPLCAQNSASRAGDGHPISTSAPRPKPKPHPSAPPRSLPNAQELARRIKDCECTLLAMRLLIREDSSNAVLYKDDLLRYKAKLADAKESLRRLPPPAQLSDATLFRKGKARPA